MSERPKNPKKEENQELSLESLITTTQEKILEKIDKLLKQLEQPKNQAATEYPQYSENKNKYIVFKCFFSLEPKRYGLKIVVYYDKEKNKNDKSNSEKPNSCTEKIIFKINILEIKKSQDQNNMEEIEPIKEKLFQALTQLLINLNSNLGSKSNSNFNLALVLEMDINLLKYIKF